MAVLRGERLGMAQHKIHGALTHHTIPSQSIFFSVNRFYTDARDIDGHQ